MPISFDATTREWEIKDASITELQSILQIGKQSIVQGLAGQYVGERYKAFLKAVDPQDCGQA